MSILEKDQGMSLRVDEMLGSQVARAAQTQLVGAGRLGPVSQLLAEQTYVFSFD